MSYDIEIITHSKPKMSCIEAFVNRQAEIKVRKVFNTTINMTVTLEESKELYISLDGPFEIDNDYCDGIFADSGISPRWLIQLSMQGAIPKDNEISAVKNIAKQLADMVQGSAYDRQESNIFWPESAQKPMAFPKKGERMSLVELRWFVSASHPYVDAVNKFLLTVHDLCREALPVRYGEYEPFQGKYNAKQSEKFIEACQESNKKLGYIFWNSEYPCFSGSLFTTNANSSEHKYKGLATININMSFDGRMLEHDNNWREKIVGLFEAVAKGIGAFYAGCYVRRNVIFKKNLLFDTQSEETPFPKSKWWLGLPSGPMWLSWFGAPYRDLVEKTIKQFITTTSEEGIFVRMGELPLNRDQLKYFDFRLPDELIFQKPKSDITGVIKKCNTLADSHRILENNQPKPAEIIPNFP